MVELIDPAVYGLPSRIKLVKEEDGSISIQRIVKSRIIRKDALKLVDIRNKILEKDPDAKINLTCTRNICSKSIVMLDEEGIGIKFID